MAAYSVWTYSFVSAVIVSLVSLLGIATLWLRDDILKKILIYFVSFSAGAMLGDVFFHLLPEISENGISVEASAFVITGIASFLVLEKIIHWRHCHIPISDEHVHPLAIMNLLGDLVHNFIDGLIIGASYIISVPVGIATTLAVILHEIPQELGDFGVLLHGGYTKAEATIFNFLTALTAIAGVAVTLALSRSVENLTMFIVPFAAGGFIYIAGSDLIPELHKEVDYKKSIVQIISFAFGAAVMLALTALG